MAVRDVPRSQRFRDMEQAAARYFDLVARASSPAAVRLRDELSARIAEARRELNALELEFNDDPAFVALLRAERQANGQ